MVYKGLGKGPEQTTANIEPTRSSNKFITKKKNNGAHAPLTSSSASNVATTNNESYKQLPGHLTPSEIQVNVHTVYLLGRVDHVLGKLTNVHSVKDVQRISFCRRNLSACTCNWSC